MYVLVIHRRTEDRVGGRAREVSRISLALDLGKPEDGILVSLERAAGGPQLP